MVKQRIIKIMIVDDHALVRNGIRRLLEDLPDMQVVAEAESGEEALEKITKSVPDVILLDMKMPGMDGWEVTRRLSKKAINIKVIALTALSSDPLPEKILQLGAMGYLTKDTNAEEMAVAIRNVAKGERYLGAKIAQKMVISRLQPNHDNPFDCLSDREIQVMLLITQGKPVQDVADQLFLSTKTINTYRYQLFEKLSLKNDVELTHFAMKYGLIDNPSELNCEKE